MLDSTESRPFIPKCAPIRTQMRKYDMSFCFHFAKPDASQLRPSYDAIIDTISFLSRGEVSVAVAVAAAVATELNFASFIVWPPPRMPDSCHDSLCGQALIAAQPAQPAAATACTVLVRVGKLLTMRKDFGRAQN